MKAVTDVPATDPYPWEQKELDQAAAVAGEGAGNEAGDHDPDAWVLRPEWEGGQAVWSNWQGWHSWDVKGEDTEDLEGGVEGEGGGNGDDEEEDEEVGEDEEEDFLGEGNFPPWAIKATTKAHEANNSLRDGERGSYCVRGGKPCFKASDQYGGMTFEAGLGRKKARSRGKSSVIKQKGKKKDKKGKEKGGKGQSKGKGKDKGKGKGSNADTAKQALNVVESALVGQNKLIDLLCSKESKELATKLEPKDDPEWHRGQWSGRGGSSGSSSSWSW